MSTISRLSSTASSNLLPKGSARIAQARATGRRPAEPVVVLMTPAEIDYETVVLARPDQDYDWSWAAGLEVTAIMRQDSPHKAAMALADAVGVPLLEVWYVDAQCGGILTAFPTIQSLALPKHRWHLELRFHPWTAVQNQSTQEWARCVSLKTISTGNNTSR